MKVTPTLHDDPCVFNTQITGAIEDAAQTLGLPHMRLSSGKSRCNGHGACALPP